jgi:hypothetical protein
MHEVKVPRTPAQARAGPSACSTHGGSRWVPNRTVVPAIRVAIRSRPAAGIAPAAPSALLRA